LRIAFQYFKVQNYGVWYYHSKSNLYHTILKFIPREGVGVLGRTWPPVQEIIDLLEVPMIKVISDEAGTINMEELQAPTLIGKEEVG